MNELYFTISLIILEIIFALMVVKSLYSAGAEKTVLGTLSAVFVVWLVSAFILLSKGLFSASGMSQLTFALGVFIPVVVGYLAKVFWKPLGHVIDTMPTESFLWLQHWRAVFGIMFFFTASLPVWFQYIGGLGDIAAGIGAFLALYRFRKQPDKERQAIINGNLIGILDFIVVLNLGLFVVLRNHSPDTMFNLIPLFVVPIFILLHIFSIQRISKIVVAS